VSPRCKEQHCLSAATQRGGYNSNYHNFVVTKASLEFSFVKFGRRYTYDPTATFRSTEAIEFQRRRRFP
jgi:hypothetical protein